MRCRLQGSGAEQSWASVSMPVPPHSTIYDLRQRIAQTGVHGSMVGANLALKAFHTQEQQLRLVRLFHAQEQQLPLFQLSAPSACSCSRWSSSGQCPRMAARGLRNKLCALTYSGHSVANAVLCLCPAVRAGTPGPVNHHGFRGSNHLAGLRCEWCACGSLQRLPLTLACTPSAPATCKAPCYVCQVIAPWSHADPPCWCFNTRPVQHMCNASAPQASWPPWSSTASPLAAPRATPCTCASKAVGCCRVACEDLGNWMPAQQPEATKSPRPQLAPSQHPQLGSPRLAVADASHWRHESLPCFYGGAAQPPPRSRRRQARATWSRPVICRRTIRQGCARLLKRRVRLISKQLSLQGST